MEKVRPTGRVREHTWDCPYCGRKNRGRDRECIGCGRPRSTETKFNMNETVAVLDGEEAKKYISGPDWFCECCDSYNPDSIVECKSCGAPRGASKNYFEMRRKQEEKEKRDRQQAAKADAVCQFIKEEQEREEKADKAAILRRCMTGIGICFAMIAFVLLMVILLKPEVKSGTVTELTWSSSISLQELVTEKDEGWDYPAGARILDTQWKFKETVPMLDHYETELQPVTKYRTVQDPDLVWTTWEDMGNGFSQEVEHRLPQSHQEPYTEMEPVQVPVYRDEDVYADWYVYEYDHWVTVRTETTSGIKGEEHDPVLEVYGTRQRLTDYSRCYRVYLDTSDEKEPSTDFSIPKDLYDIMEPGSMVIYQQNKLGMTTVTEIDGQAVGTPQEGE